LKISAIISTYNRAQFLPGLFDSIKNQTLPADKFEVIIINNNSTDNTELLSMEFCNNNDGIKVYYYIESHQGLSFGRNRGISESNFDLVTFIDASVHILRQVQQEEKYYLNSQAKNQIGIILFLRRY